MTLGWILDRPNKLQVNVNTNEHGTRFSWLCRTAQERSMTPQRVIPKVSQSKLVPFNCQRSFGFTGRAVRVENMKGELRPS